MEQYPEDYKLLDENLTDEEKQDFNDKMEAYEETLALKFANELEEFRKKLMNQFKKIVITRNAWK